YLPALDPVPIEAAKRGKPAGLRVHRGVVHVLFADRLNKPRCTHLLKIPKNPFMIRIVRLRIRLVRGIEGILVVRLREVAHELPQYIKRNGRRTVANRDQLRDVRHEQRALLPSTENLIEVSIDASDRYLANDIGSA